MFCKYSAHTCWYLLGIHGEIAEAKSSYWSSFAPRPGEVVLAAGQKAKEDDSFSKYIVDSLFLYLYQSFHFSLLVVPSFLCDGAAYDDPERREQLPCDLNENCGDLTVESMLLVEKGLRELVSLKVCMKDISKVTQPIWLALIQWTKISSLSDKQQSNAILLKVEDAVLFAMAQRRHRNTKRSNVPGLYFPALTYYHLAWFHQWRSDLSYLQVDYCHLVVEACY